MVEETFIHPDIQTLGVLVVDDSALQRAFTVEALNALGITRVEQAHDGLDALQRLRAMQTLPAVAIIDLEMPGMDGIELLHHIADIPAPPAIIVASSKETGLISSVETMVQDLALPMLGGLGKPVSSRSLMQLLTRFGHTTPLESEQVNGTQEAPDEKTLCTAINTGQIRPYFQAKANLSNGRIKGVEALARWFMPDGSMIEPNSFVESVEAYGLMPQMTISMLDQAIIALQQWNAAGISMTVAINLSPLSLGDMQLADTIVRRALKAGITPEQLQFEVTETAMMKDASAMGTLLRLKLRGFCLSIDDYGTGFSSMQQLSRLPFSELKIDRSFVAGASRRAHIRTMLESAIEMAQRLGLTTVAEGVESEDDWRLLKELGCTLAQGYLISRPIAADEIPNLVNRYSGPPPELGLR